MTHVLPNIISVVRADLFYFVVLCLLWHGLSVARQQPASSFNSNFLQHELKFFIVFICFLLLLGMALSSHFAMPLWTFNFFMLTFEYSHMLTAQTHSASHSHTSTDASSNACGACWGKFKWLGSVEVWIRGGVWEAHLCFRLSQTSALTTAGWGTMLLMLCSGKIAVEPQWRISTVIRLCRPVVQVVSPV